MWRMATRLDTADINNDVLSIGSSVINLTLFNQHVVEVLKVLTVHINNLDQLNLIDILTLNFIFATAQAASTSST
jgi:hypothetical protein